MIKLQARSFLTVEKCEFYNLAEYIFAFIMICLSSPYFMWGIPVISNVLTLILLGMSFIFFNRIRFSKIVIGLIYLIVMGYYSREASPLGFIIQMSFILIFFLPEDKMSAILDKYKLILSVILFLSLISYFLIVFLNINFNYKIIEPLVSRKGYNYKVYSFLVIPNLDLTDIGKWRFCGIFDEPGVIGTISAFLLYCDNYNLKKRTNLVFFIAGLASMSFFFIGITIVYYLQFINLKSLFIIAFSGILFVSLTSDNPVLDKLVYSRFKVNDKGELAADNRASASYKEAYTALYGSEDIFFGKGIGETLKITKNISSYRSLIYDSGILPFFLFLLFLTFNAFFTIKRKKEIILYLVIIGGIIYQRPFIQSPLFIFFMFFGVAKFKELSFNKHLAK